MRFSTLPAWLEWQAGLNSKAIDLGLGRVSAVWHALGAPSLDAAVLTVAGTNGKGSSVAFAEAILMAAGYSCGCYTSPHLQRYNERIRIDGNAIDDDAVCEAFQRIDDARGDIALTYFEFGTLAALLYFASADLDAVVLEVGLGGRLDAVNLIDADVALITSIALDHQDWLGDDIEKIGYEKAGIMRARRPAVYSGNSMPASIRAHAEHIGASLFVAGADYRVVRHAGHWDLLSEGKARRALPLPGMRGVVQTENAAGVLMALEQVSNVLPLDDAAVCAGLLAARVPGRFDVRPGQPTWLLDVAHNPASATVLDGMLAEICVSGDKIAVCGMLDDKDAEAIAAALKRRFDRWVIVDLSSQPRGMRSDQLAERLGSRLADDMISIGGTPEQVFADISASARKDDLIVVFGSFLTVGAAMAWLEQHQKPAAQV